MKRSPMPRRNPKRLRESRAKQFGPQSELCRTLPCSFCGREPCIPHHVKSRGAGGVDSDCAPLCTEHHEAGHLRGWKEYERTWGVNLAEVAARLAEQIAGEDA